MNEPTTKAGRWLVDRSQWDDGLRAFRVRINNTAGPDDMHRHVLAIEQEAAAIERVRIAALVRRLTVVVFMPEDIEAIYRGESLPIVPKHAVLAMLEEQS